MSAEAKENGERKREAAQTPSGSCWCESSDVARMNWPKMSAYNSYLAITLLHQHVIVLFVLIKVVDGDDMLVSQLFVQTNFHEKLLPKKSVT